jgi:hypothetical protein
MAGEGVLKDGSKASDELREYLAAVPIEILARYLNECLTTTFEESGFVLQDIVNELGSRLGCQVERGLYRGKQSEIGFDGIWRFPGGYTIVVETKTTDTYNIQLDKIADYRKTLIKNGKLSENSSILIVVGRRQTGSLESQVRGSRHAWDVRLISADKLLRLVQIKQNADNKATIEKIQTVLTPLELTKVDFVVDLLATTAEDLQEGTEGEEEVEEAVEVAKREKKFTPVAFHANVAEKVGEVLGLALKKTTRSLYVSADQKICVRAVVSRPHPSGQSTYYWYAFHPYYKDALDEYSESHIAFGCGEPEKILLFDLREFVGWLPDMNTTEKEDRMYWHVHFIETPDGSVSLQLKGGKPNIDVTDRLVR